MRGRAPSSITRLDVSETVKATIKNRWSFVPSLFSKRKEIPDYLFLIDYSNENNHRALLFNAWYKWLREQDIYVRRYYYQSNPRIVWNEHHPDGVDLSTLSEQFSNSKLFILGDAWRLLKQQSGRFAESIHLLEEWKERFILTPLSLDKWTWREKKLEELFKVVPFNEKSISHLEKHLNAEKPISLDQYLQKTRKEPGLILDEKDLKKSVDLYFFFSNARVACCSIFFSRIKLELDFIPWRVNSKDQ